MIEDLAVRGRERRAARMTTSQDRGMRGAMELKVLALIVLLSAAGALWVQLRHEPSGGQERLFRYKDERGKTVYTDTIERVPESQRQAALNDKELPNITTADYDQFVEAFSEKKGEQERGLWDSLKGMLGAQSSEVEAPKNSGNQSKKESSPTRDGNPARKELLKDLSDVQGVVKDSFSSISSRLEGSN
jgi:hypothetical protein